MNGMTGFRCNKIRICWTAYLRLWEVVATRITVVKIGVNDGSGNGTGSYRIGNSECDEYDRPNFRLWRDMEFHMKR